MTKEQILNGNRLIADSPFSKEELRMAIEKDKKAGESDYYCYGNLGFHSSFDWIMPVIIKIQSETECVFQIYKKGIVCIYDYNVWQLREDMIELRHQYNFNDNNPLPHLWQAVTDYIQWRNAKNTPPTTI